LSQTADELETNYFRQKATEAKEAEPSHRIVIVLDNEEEGRG
jgi:hypothetical protein